MLGCVALSGCGYVLKGTRTNETLEKENIRSVFLEAFTNDSFKPGVEVVVYNQMLKAITYSSAIRVVNSREDADAILKGSVSASTSVQNVTPASELFPMHPVATNPYRAGATVARDYSAVLSASFTLERVAREGKPAGVLWGGSFSQSMQYPANNQMGVFGTTSHLINESEFDRALVDLATKLSIDATENLFSSF